MIGYIVGKSAQAAQMVVPIGIVIIRQAAKGANGAIRYFAARQWQLIIFEMIGPVGGIVNATAVEVALDNVPQLCHTIYWRIRVATH